MPGGAFVLGSRLNLDAAEALILDAFARQRERLVAIAHDLGDEEWATPSRCSAWDVHELLLHVVGATDACRETLTGGQPVFGGSFDPNATPSEFVDRCASLSASTAVELLEASIASDCHRHRAAARPLPVLQVPSIWGEPIDWRLFVAHMFFDGWMHERDLLIPLGREPTVFGTEARLAGCVRASHRRDRGRRLRPRPRRDASPGWRRRGELPRHREPIRCRRGGPADSTVRRGGR